MALIMITSILLFVGGLSAGIIIGGFGGYAASSGVAKLKQTKARAELPDDELYREAYNEVAGLTGDVRVAKKKEVVILAPQITNLAPDDVPILSGQHWKVVGIKTPVRVESVKDDIVSYYDYDAKCTIGSRASWRKAAKVVD